MMTALLALALFADHMEINVRFVHGLTFGLDQEDIYLVDAETEEPLVHEDSGEQQMGSCVSIHLGFIRISMMFT